MKLSAFEMACLQSTLRTLRLQPTDILDGENRIPDNQNDPLLRVARPTWIGKDYEPGGVLLLGKNPAGGSISHKEISHPSDHAFAAALKQLYTYRDVDSYHFWRDVAQPNAMATWRIWNISALAVIEALKPLGLDANSIAFGNLVPFRTEGNTVSSREYILGWERDVSHVISILKPCLIIKMTADFQKFSQYCTTTVVGFRRSNGDRGITPSGWADLQIIGTWAKRWAASITS